MRKRSLRSFLESPELKAREKKAADARQEFRDTVDWSDAYLLAMIVVFTALGHLYPIKRKSQMWVGIALFVGAFCFYCVLKSWEKERKAKEQKLLKELKEIESRETTPLKQEEKAED
eukprot:TRINITY_DN36963_c1_g1_i1.p1 TRINITY_DN36963_c1_g1~~TRINITY_DN36963_c1_g1_i1.p1  ORF type:complete len:117 (-),score=29.95 TRINITY_DN36963_c1_g1_i1:67-417(-)